MTGLKDGEIQRGGAAEEGGVGERALGLVRTNGTKKLLSSLLLWHSTTLSKKSKFRFVEKLFSTPKCQGSAHSSERGGWCFSCSGCVH